MEEEAETFSSARDCWLLSEYEGKRCTFCSKYIIRIPLGKVKKKVTESVMKIDTTGNISSLDWLYIPYDKEDKQYLTCTNE